jgi:hypothetical protein
VAALLSRGDTWRHVALRHVVCGAALLLLQLQHYERNDAEYARREQRRREQRSLCDAHNHEARAPVQHTMQRRNAACQPCGFCARLCLFVCCFVLFAQARRTQRDDACSSARPLAHDACSRVRGVRPATDNETTCN